MTHHPLGASRRTLPSWCVKTHPTFFRQIKLMLANPVYRGALCYNKCSQGKIHGIAADGRARAKRSPRCQPNGRDRWIVVEGVHEPLVSQEVFEKAQAEMARRRDAKGQARPTHRYLLSGLLKCTHCGLNYWGAVLKLYAKGVRRPYYVDAEYRRFGPKVCKSTSIQAEALDQWVLGKVRQVILNDAEGTQAAVDAFIEQIMVRQKPGEERSSIDKELASLNRRIQATVAMLADPDLSDMNELKQGLVDLKRQREILEARKEQATAGKGEPVNEAALRKCSDSVSLAGGRDAAGVCGELRLVQVRVGVSELLEWQGAGHAGVARSGSGQRVELRRR